MGIMLSAIALFLACSAASGSAADEFQLWYDGQAEVNGYRWKGTRYGELRAGEAIAIFVTEPMGLREHVKVDHPDQYRGEVLTVLKLNLVRDFQTGLYDYNTMTSVFVGVDDLRALKQTFTSAEWCGHVYEELDVRAKNVDLDVRSYFEGESTLSALPSKPNGLLGDQIWIFLRGLRGAVLTPGETRSFPYVADPFERRLRHTAARWGELEIQRQPNAASASVPAGTFQAVEYRLRASDGRDGRAWIEEASPHRLLSWSWARGTEVLDAGELTGSRRLKYWELHAQGNEVLRRDLGLERTDGLAR